MPRDYVLVLSVHTRHGFLSFRPRAAVELLPLMVGPNKMTGCENDSVLLEWDELSLIWAVSATMEASYNTLLSRESQMKSFQSENVLLF